MCLWFSCLLNRYLHVHWQWLVHSLLCSGVHTLPIDSNTCRTDCIYVLTSLSPTQDSKLPEGIVHISTISTSQRSPHPQCQAHCLARARCLKSVYQIVYLLWHSSFQPFLLVRDKEKKGKLSQGHLFLMLFPLLKTHFKKKLALWHHVYYLCDFQTTLKSQASFILVLNL